MIEVREPDSWEDSQRSPDRELREVIRIQARHGIPVSAIHGLKPSVVNEIVSAEVREE